MSAFNSLGPSSCLLQSLLPQGDEAIIIPLYAHQRPGRVLVHLRTLLVALGEAKLLYAICLGIWSSGICCTSVTVVSVSMIVHIVACLRSGDDSLMC